MWVSLCADSVSFNLVIPSWVHQRKEAQPVLALLWLSPALLSFFWNECLFPHCVKHVGSSRSLFPKSSTVTLESNLCSPLMWEGIENVGIKCISSGKTGSCSFKWVAVTLVPMSFSQKEETQVDTHLLAGLTLFCLSYRLCKDRLFYLLSYGTTDQY